MPNDELLYLYSIFFHIILTPAKLIVVHKKRSVYIIATQMNGKDYSSIAIKT